MLFSRIFSEYSKEAKILLLSALLEVCCFYALWLTSHYCNSDLVSLKWHFADRTSGCAYATVL